MFATSTLAYAGFLDQITSVASKVLSNKEGNTANNAEIGTTDAQIGVYQELKQGMYGIPFGVTVEELIQWLNQNNVELVNPKKKDVEVAIKLADAQVDEWRKKGLLNDNSNVLPIDQTGLVSDRKDNLEMLKNPTISYKGEDYILLNTPIVDIPNDQNGVCDYKIRNIAFMLYLTPTVEMQKDGVMEVSIYIFKDDNKLKSYACTLYFKSRLAWENIAKALNEKYGKPVLFSVDSGYTYNESTYNTELASVGMIPNLPISKLILPSSGDIFKCPNFQDIIYLLGKPGAGKDFSGHFNSSDYLYIWKRNIVGIRDNATFNGFIYYDSELGEKVIGLRKKALENCQQETQEKDKQDKERLNSRI